MRKTTINVEELISNLASELTPIQTIRNPITNAIMWGIFSTIYILLIIKFLGIRSDFNVKMQDPTFVFELVNIFTIAITASFCSIWLCIPDMREQNWMLAIPTTLFISFVLWIGLKAMMENFVAPDLHWHHCHENSLLMGSVPTVTILFLTMRGKTTRPIIMTFMNVLAVGGLSYAGLRLTCGSDDIGHLSFFHILPYLLLGVLAGALGRRIYRW